MSNANGRIQQSKYLPGLRFQQQSVLWAVNIIHLCVGVLWISEYVARKVLWFWMANVDYSLYRKNDNRCAKQITWSLMRSALQQQQQHSCTLTTVSPLNRGVWSAALPVVLREGLENNEEDRGSWGEPWGETGLELGQPGTGRDKEPGI